MLDLDEERRDLKMWFRLKRRYSGKNEILHVYGIKGVKKGAPVHVELHFSGHPSFIIGEGNNRIKLNSLTLKHLSLPEQCVKDGPRNVLCVTVREFYHLSDARGKVLFCPGCGKKLVQLPDFPWGEDLRRYLVYDS